MCDSRTVHVPYRHVADQNQNTLTSGLKSTCCRFIEINILTGPLFPIRTENLIYTLVCFLFVTVRQIGIKGI